MIEEESDFLEYIELCCFLSAYFKLTILRNDIDWQMAINEIVENCTEQCVITIIAQLNLLLRDRNIQGDRLLLWVTRYADGWQCTTPAQAHRTLEQLRDDLSDTLQANSNQSIIFSAA